MSKATVRDVAAAAGVSASTVSNFFHHPGRISGATGERIRRAIDELGFVPNDAARRLRAGASSIIGYLTFELSSAFTPAIARAIRREAGARGMHVLMANDDESSQREHTYLELFEMQRVSGLIVAPMDDIEETLLDLKRRGTPSVLSAWTAQSPHLASAAADGVLGGYLAAQHLIATGRRRLAFVTSSLELRQMSDRLEGALKAVHEAPGTQFEIIQVADRTVASGVRTAQEIATRPADHRPDGVFCANDLLAIGLVQELSWHSDVAVPAEVAVIGYDDNEFAATGAIPLSSIRVSADALGTAAVDLLFEEMKLVEETPSGRLPATPSRHVLFKPELVIRESTARRT